MTGATNRPPFETTQWVKIQPPDEHGHVFVQADGYLYPCKGCGCEHSGVGGGNRWSLPCPAPYSDPKAVTAQLDQVIGLLQAILARML